MPEAVKTFLSTESFNETQNIHRDILDTYIDDFSKYAKKEQLSRIQKVFNMIPQIQGNKVKYSNISSEDKSADIKMAIDLLCKAKICSKVYYTNCSGLPIGAGKSEKTYKLIFLDSGYARGKVITLR